MTGEPPRLHPTARIGANAIVGNGVSIGEHSELAVNVVIGSSAAIGARASIGAGAFLAAGSIVGDGVVIGPNASVLGVEESQDPSAPGARMTTVHDGASIGANASVIGGVTVGVNAVVGAGAVVTRDVPPFATVVGAPARIVGYRSSPSFTVRSQLRASSLADDEFPLTIGRAKLARLPLITDLRGSLSVGELPTDLPFPPQRYFVVFDAPSREVRGEHAHLTLEEYLICVHGECVVAVDDGTERGQVVLDRPDTALHLPPMVWSIQYDFSPDAVLLVLASDVYDPDDYIRSYEEFREAVARD